MNKIIWELPLLTVSEANRSEHWTQSSKRHRQQQFFIRRLFEREVQEIPIPCVIKLIRCSTRYLDDDNLRSAFKWIRDEISECIFPNKRKSYVDKKGKLRQIKGRADDSPLLTWEYIQVKSSLLGIRIEISSLIAPPLKCIDCEES